MLLRIENYKKIIAYLIGILTCQNVIYAFKFGNSYINILYVITVFFVLSYYFFTGSTGIVKQYIDKSLLLFLMIIYISVIPATFWYFEGTLTKFTTYIYGLINIGLGLSLLFSVFILRDKLEYIYKGIWHGFIICVLISVIQFVAFNTDKVFSLYFIFPQPSFYISTSWVNAQNLQLEFPLFFYRASGMFLETSYYLAFASVFIVPIILHVRPSIVKKIVIYIFSGLILISASGNIILLIIAILFWSILKKKTVINKNVNYKLKNLNASKYIIVVLVLVPTSILFINYIGLDVIIEKIVDSINTANIMNEDNTTRFNNMIKGISLICKYPLGIGYNFSPTLMKSEFGINQSAFNYLITLAIELSIVGMIAYILMILSFIIRLIKRKNNNSISLMIALICAFISQIGNGIGLSSYIWVLIALICIELNTDKNTTIISV